MIFSSAGFWKTAAWERFHLKEQWQGTGLALNTINATLDGNIREFSYQGYTYEDIFVNGQVRKKRFDGKIISNDSNLHATLIGLIDLSKELPKFDFQCRC